MSKYRLLISLALMIIVPLGFLTKFYSGPAELWINNSLGGLFYEIFWCLVIAFIFSESKPVKIAFWVFVITCLLEFLQLWHPSFLEWIRSNYLGRTILGNSFNWSDFIYYFLGSSLGYAILSLFRNLPARTLD
jgi:hypothetical protein